LLKNIALCKAVVILLTIICKISDSICYKINNAVSFSM
jgi:hypothetical protein